MKRVGYSRFGFFSFKPCPNERGMIFFITEIIFHFLIIFLPLSAIAQTPVDSIPSDSIFGPVRKDYPDRKQNPDWWINRIKANNINMSDTSVIYPGFINFCVKVYRWGDKAFNSYDTTYVKGTGKRWKAMVRNDNWTDSYALTVGKEMPIIIMSEPHVNAGAYLQYMAVSLGYSLDLSNVIGNKALNHKKMEFGFTCARFTADFHYTENTGGSTIRKFGDYNNGRFFKENFPGVRMRSIGVQAYYFFNNRKYSQGVVYSFSKLQIKSAGSFILGYNYNNLHISIDMNEIPENLIPYLTISPKNYKFHYNNYCIMGGYGYNLAFAKNWVFNITLLPSVGLAVTYADDYTGKKKSLALNIFGRTGIVWNISDFFLGVTAKIDGSWYFNKDLRLFNSIQALSANVGVRF